MTTAHETNTVQPAAPSLSSRPSVQIPPSQIPNPVEEPAVDPEAVAYPLLSPFPPVQELEADPLTRLEKRRLLAQIVRANLLDCFDDSGAFDLARAPRILPPCAVQSLIIHETSRTDKTGNTTVRRKITLRLVDKIRAMRLDDILDPEEKPNLAATKRSAEELKKALAEANARELQTSKKLKEKDQQLQDILLVRQREEARLAAMYEPPPAPPLVNAQGQFLNPVSQTLSTAGGKACNAVQGPPSNGSNGAAEQSASTKSKPKSTIARPPPPPAERPQPFFNGSFYF